MFQYMTCFKIVFYYCFKLSAFAVPLFTPNSATSARAAIIHVRFFIVFSSLLQKGANTAQHSLPLSICSVHLEIARNDKFFEAFISVINLHQNEFRSALHFSHMFSKIVEPAHKPVYDSISHSTSFQAVKV